MPERQYQPLHQKAAGDANADNYEEISLRGLRALRRRRYRGALTDNRNRTASDVRHLFDKYGNGLG
jgi:transcriptional/translational regulatory protein YebC/TACO1